MFLSKLIGRLAMKPLSKALPPMGETERAALEAGTVGFEGQLFAGRPDFSVFAEMGANKLSQVEQDFLDNEVCELIAMLDDHAIDQACDLPPDVWRFMREKRFFGMVIPRDFGGLGFGYFAHAAVVTRIASVNVAAAVTVMVPIPLVRANCCCTMVPRHRSSIICRALPTVVSCRVLASLHLMPALMPLRSPTEAYCASAS